LKKEAKTFATWCRLSQQALGHVRSRPLGVRAEAPRTPKYKSFLVLFFKKEPLLKPC
jgi:hypothetical protein